MKEQQYPFAYGGINIYDSFNTCDGLLPFTHQKVVPVTKEQRELLFQKMNEEGYEWDAKKKELKKIYNEIEIPFGAKDSELQEVTYYIPKGFHAEIDGDKVVIKKGEKPTAWSEKDETALGDALWCCKQAASIAKNENDTGNVWYAETWLKSLKERYTWKPTDEQMAALNNINITGCISYLGQGQELINLYNDLKKLKGIKL